MGNSVTNKNGYKLDFNVALAFMEEEIREVLYNSYFSCNEHEVLKEYEKAHALKYGEDWFLSAATPSPWRYKNEKEFLEKNLYTLYHVSRSYGHMWAIENDWPDIEGKSIYEIYQRTYDKQSDWVPAGIWGPELVETKHGLVVTHESTSGRLKYKIFNDRVLAEIYRPNVYFDPEEVSYDEYVENKSVMVLSFDGNKITRHNPETPVYDRHLSAMIDFVAAYTGDTDISSNIQDAYIREYGLTIEAEE